ncbi:hypothetical protein ACHAXT_002409 [Thalassiosira profunda]
MKGPDGLLGRQAPLALCALLYFHSVAATAAFVSPARQGVTSTSCRAQVGNRHITVLSAATDGNENSSGTSKSARERGIYARPSAAIEKGSGFFIPGLEGSRIRFLFGITVLLADAANHALVGGRPGDWGQLVAESLAAFYGTLLLLQGSIELGVEKGYSLGSEGEDASASVVIEGGGTLSMPGGINSQVSDDVLKEEMGSVEVLQRIAQTIITFTPATCFLLVDGESGVLYSYGVGATPGVDANEQKRLGRLSLDSVAGSKGGRVALPREHPVSKLLPEAATRCILVQKAEGSNGAPACMVIGSDKLLPSFTKNDLRWIGQLAEYNSMG